MARVEVAVDEVTLENEDGKEVEGLLVTCSECDHEVEVFGVSERSVRRACVTLKEECPLGRENYYVADEE
jgi:hypothetical protein